MNRSVQAERNEVLRLFDPMRKKHLTPEMTFNKSNTIFHEREKFHQAWEHYIKGHVVATEAYFLSGKRADIVCLDEKLIIEIAMSEKEASLVRKRESYPKELKLEVIKI